MELYISILAAFIGSGLFSWFFLPEIQRICFEKKLFDSHDERKVHTGIVPRLGGVGFFPSMILSFLLVVSVNLFLQTPLITGIDLPSLLEWTLVLSAIFIMYLTGIVDDLVEVRHRSKLLIQIVAAALFIASGIWIDNLHGLFGIYEINALVGIPLTILVIVYMCRANYSSKGNLRYANELMQQKKLRNMVLVINDVDEFHHGYGYGYGYGYGRSYGYGYKDKKKKRK